MNRAEKVAKLLSVNGEAGSVGVNPDGSACFQYFVAQSGPFAEKTPVTVLGPKEIADLLSLIDQQGEPERKPEGMTYATRWDLLIADEHGELTVRKYDPTKNAIPVWIGNHPSGNWICCCGDHLPTGSREREASEHLKALQEIVSNYPTGSMAYLVAQRAILTAEAERETWGSSGDVEVLEQIATAISRPFEEVESED